MYGYVSASFFQVKDKDREPVTIRPVGDGAEVAVDLSGYFGSFLSLHMDSIDDAEQLGQAILRAAAMFREEKANCP